jgi:hypothetical protein
MKGTKFQFFFLISFETHPKCKICASVEKYWSYHFKIFLNELSGPTSAISRYKGSFILHDHNTLPLLLQFVSFLYADDPVSKD